MFTYTTNRALSLLLLLLTSTSVWSVEFPVPDFFDLSIVSEDMSYSGVALSVAQFSSSKGVSDIERYYEAEWPDTRVSKLENIFVISYLDEDEGALYTVQVNGDWRKKEHLEGYLSISNIPQLIEDPDKHTTRPGHGFPLHVSGKVVNDIGWLIKATGFNGGDRRLVWYRVPVSGHPAFGHHPV